MKNRTKDEKDEKSENSENSKNIFQKDKPPGHNNLCPKKPTIRKLVVKDKWKKHEDYDKAMEVEDADKEIKKLVSQPAIMKIKNPVEKTKFAYTVARMNKTRVLAAIDTMSNISCISPYLATQLNVKVNPVQGKLEMADGSTEVDRVGITEPIEIFHNGKVVNHQFEILYMGFDIACPIN
ncbi:hypothetical protein ROZALSC1DRAFT_26155, partial [Rozella allomycis CSF55]